MAKVSRMFRERAKLSEIPIYKVAQAAGVAPQKIYRAVRGIIEVRTDDPGIRAVGKLLGLNENEMFER